ncbi:choline transporter-like protein [Anaeramoeba ignava]|uniref:Choline transporter-like protein n=1 Tax=Anaeramoeba ignava TaxID=1746090 RepID=A0A9Q0LGU3_ANAIG|nr:choline transporter-like protein [Anaeramoeba ignava]
MVWLTVLCFLASLGLLTWYFYVQWQNSSDISSEKKMDSNKRNALGFKTMFWIMIAVDVIAVILVIYLRKRIMLAIALIKEAVSAVRAMPTIFFFPFITFLMLLALYAYWIAVASFLMSSGKPKAKYDDGLAQYYLDYENTTAMNYLTIYHFFGLLWGTMVIIAITESTIAGAISSWYWTRDKHNLPPSPIKSAFKRMLRYHLGSLAYGALLLSIVRMIRYTIEVIQRKLMKANQNKCVNYCFYCMKYCFWCLEGWLKFITRNAYIMIAVYGESFCKSTKRAWNLIGRNILRMLAVSVVGSYLFFLGKVMVTSVVLVISLAILKSMDSIAFYIIPAIICAILAYGIASAFFSVFEMTVDTMLLCFCEDCERHDGSSPDREPYASEKLRKFMDKNISKDSKHEQNDKHGKPKDNDDDDDEKL